MDRIWIKVVRSSCAALKGTVLVQGRTVMSKAFHAHAEESAGFSYQDAISKLNSLQSNAQSRAKMAKERDTRREKSLQEMTLFLETVGISKKDLESLNVIHVAGTKGKGTTCAFTESILRTAGLKTGFYSSPHLVVVRERIRINGEPISPEKFTQYFFSVYNKLYACKEKDSEFMMPAYFRFLTCVAFYTFLKEKVDVAIMEVGIGGRYDCTNVVPNPTVVGITTLGLEHQALLGNTLEEIAANKAGIMKPNSPAFTVFSQAPNAFQVLQDCADSVNCNLSVVPSISELSQNVRLGVNDGNVSELNAALAVQLATSFLAKKFPDKLKSEGIISSGLEPCKLITSYHVEGLERTKWPGRFQHIMTSDTIHYYLDGAHTKDSLAIALNWFKKVSAKPGFRVLIFNVTGERGCDLLSPFVTSNFFNLAIFCPVMRRGAKSDSDNWNVLSEGTDPLAACRKFENAWRSTNSSPTLLLDSTDAATDFINVLSDPATRDEHFEFRDPIDTVSVLVTGSLHLVGNMLSILDDSLNDK